ncbi:hypothetical protein CVCC1112_2875 [Paenarthrobacter nicotinovorans]|nr:hypothetical protein CVCC1112_2875 [Paenarthrobacter nicotinovorans]
MTHAGYAEVPAGNLRALVSPRHRPRGNPGPLQRTLQGYEAAWDRSPASYPRCACRPNGSGKVAFHAGSCAD